VSDAGEICSIRRHVAICVLCARQAELSCVSAARAQKLFLLGISAALRAGKVLDADPERM
jgi:hypothetical protein